MADAARDVVGSTDDYMTVAEAAALLKVTPGYIRDSDCPKVKLPGNGPKGKAIIRIRRAAFNAWVEGHEARATTPQRRRTA